jgi:hypothetical protein
LPYFDSPTWKYGVSVGRFDEVAGRIDQEEAHVLALDLPAEDERHVEVEPGVLQCLGIAVIHVAHRRAQHARGIEHALGVPDGDGVALRAVFAGFAQLFDLQDSRTDCEMLRLPEDSSTMTRSPGCS